MTYDPAVASIPCAASSAAVPEDIDGGLSISVGIEPSGETLDAFNQASSTGRLPGSFTRQPLASAERKKELHAGPGPDPDVPNDDERCLGSNTTILAYPTSLKTEKKDNRNRSKFKRR